MTQMSGMVLPPEVQHVSSVIHTLQCPTSLLRATTYPQICKHNLSERIAQPKHLVNDATQYGAAPTASEIVDEPPDDRL